MVVILLKESRAIPSNTGSPSNNGSAPINSLKVTDPLDRNLLLCRTDTRSASFMETLCSVRRRRSSPVCGSGEDANFDYAFLNDGVLFIDSRIVGALQPGSSGCVLFKVRINE